MERVQQGESENKVWGKCGDEWEEGDLVIFDNLKVTCETKQKMKSQKKVDQQFQIHRSNTPATQKPVRSRSR